MRYIKISFIILLAGKVFGDGWNPCPPGSYIEQKAQVAIVKRDGYTEEILFDVKFEGDTKGFAWVIPFSSLPSVDSVSTAIFHALQYHARPLYKQRGVGCGCGEKFPYDFGGGREEKASPSEPKEVGGGVIGDLQYKILEASNAVGLKEYLEENGYEYPSEATPLLEEYIEKDWNYFMVGKADTSKKYSSGEIGVRVSFSSSSIVYPMKITSLSAEEMDLILYVLAEHKVTFEGARLKFADFVSPEDVYGDPSIVDKTYFLTKLWGHFSPGEFEDLEIEWDSNNEAYREVIFYSWGGDAVIFAGLFGFIFLRRKKKYRNWKLILQRCRSFGQG